MPGMKPRMPTSRKTAPTSAASDWTGVRSRIVVASWTSLSLFCPARGETKRRGLLAGVGRGQRNRKRGPGEVVAAPVTAATAAAATTAVVATTATAAPVAPTAAAAAPVGRRGRGGRGRRGGGGGGRGGRRGRCGGRRAAVMVAVVAAAAASAVAAPL